METIAGLHAGVRLRNPDAVAVAYEGRRITRAELDDAGRRAARGLSELGVGPGDRVGLWLPNTPAWIILWLACARLGAISVAVNTRFRALEIADIVYRSGAKVLALWPGFRGISFLDILGEADPGAFEALESVVLYGEHGETQTPVLPAALAACRRVTFRQLLERPPHHDDLATPDAGSTLFTTSGTTRAPKFVLHSHASVTTHARTVARELGYPEQEGGVLGALPLCGVFGFCQTTAALAAGRTLALMNAFDAAQAVRLVDEHRVRCLNATDDMVMAMFDATAREVALPTVESCNFAAFAAQPDALRTRAEARGLRLVGLYGMSEVQAFFARQPVGAAPERRLLGGGLPLHPRAAVRIRDPDSGRLLAPGESGEIELFGPSRMREYFGHSEATAKTLTADGFVRSGDLGYGTEDGGFVYVARMSDTMRLGGFLVSPAEIEAHLNEHPGVSGAQVVGIMTEHGPRAVAFVTTESDRAIFDEEVLQEHCVGALARFKVPARIFPVDEFPTTKSANGTKIRRAELRRMAEAWLATG